MTGKGQFQKIILLSGLNLYQILLHVALTPLYLRHLGLDGYAIVGFFLTLLSIASILDTALSSAVLREVAWLRVRPGREREIPGLVLSTEKVLWCAVVILGLVVFAGLGMAGQGWFFDAGRFAPQMPQIWFFMAAAFVAGFPSGFYNGILTGYQKQSEAGAWGALGHSIRGLGSAATLVWISNDIRLFFLWNFMAGAVQTWAMRRAVLRNMEIPAPHAGFSWKQVESLREFGGGIFLVTCFSSLALNADKLILGKTLPLQELGIYMVVWSAVAGLSRLITPLTMVYSPAITEHLSTGNLRELTACLRRFYRLILILLVPVVTTLAFFAEPLFLWWTAQPVLAAESGPLVLWLGIGLLFQSVCYPITTLLYADKKPQVILWGTLGTGLALILALLVVVPGHGSWGAALCMSLFGLANLLYLTTAALKIFASSLVSVFAGVFLSLGLVLIPLGMILLPGIHGMIPARSPWAVALFFLGCLGACLLAFVRKREGGLSLG